MEAGRRDRALRALRRHGPWAAALVAAALLLRATVLAPERVSVVRLVPRDLVATVYGNGTVEAKVVVPVSSKATGRVRELFADQGDRVRRGQLLARLEDEDVSQQELQAEAQARRAAAALAAEEAGLRKGRASLELAERNAARYRSLAERDFVPRTEAEQYATAARVAAEEVGRSTAAVEAARLEHAAARAGQGFAASRRRDTALLAPGDGVVLSRELEAGGTVTPGMPVFRIADPAVVWVRAHVDESLLSGVAVGKAASVALRSAPAAPLSGRVARIGRESDRVTEELEVDVAFDSPRQEFRLGEQADVRIVAATRKGAPSLPAAALATRDGRRGVWTVREGRLAFRPVVTGIEDRDGFVEVTGGIDAATEVALPPTGRAAAMRDGQRVRVAR